MIGSSPFVRDTLREKTFRAVNIGILQNMNGFKKGVCGDLACSKNERSLLYVTMIFLRLHEQKHSPPGTAGCAQASEKSPTASEFGDGSGSCIGCFIADDIADRLPQFRVIRDHLLDHIESA
jgi:hypothetical protein